MTYTLHVNITVANIIIFVFVVLKLWKAKFIQIRLFSVFSLPHMNSVLFVYSTQFSSVWSVLWWLNMEAECVGSISVVVLSKGIVGWMGWTEDWHSSISEPRDWYTWTFFLFENRTEEMYYSRMVCQWVSQHFYAVVSVIILTSCDHSPHSGSRSNILILWHCGP